MEILKIDANNLETNNLCCALANKQQTKSKKGWMAPLLQKGLTFLKYPIAGKVFIEYAPIDIAWRAIIGENIFVIHCLWVSGRYKHQWLGKNLLHSCIQDARKQNQNGIAIVSHKNKTPFLTDISFFLSTGFVSVDTNHLGYELLYLPLKDVPTTLPYFSDSAKKGIISSSTDFSIFYTRQCPFNKGYCIQAADFLLKNGKTVEIRELTSRQEVLEFWGCVGSCAIYKNGMFLTHQVPSPTLLQHFL